VDETDMEEIRARLLAVVFEAARGRDDGDNGKHDGKQRGLRVVRAVLPVGSSLVGKTAGDAEFRTKYLAAIVAISRGGTNPQGALKDVRFLPRDVLVLQVRHIRSGYQLTLAIGPLAHFTHENHCAACLLQ